MSTPILATKLYIPPPRPQLILRPRLTQRLNACLHSGQKLTLIVAPPGFGKTTLLSEWLHHFRWPIADFELNTSSENSIENPQSKIENLKTAWVSLDEQDNDPVRFWGYVISALDQFQPDLCQETLSLLHSPQAPPIETTLTSLINAVATLPPHLLLILDDYHVIEAAPIHQAFAFLLDHLPPQLHVILTSRADPPLPLTRLRVRGQLTELRQDDLRFTLAEAVTFFNQGMQLNLSPDDIMALEQRTEGWIAGLQLAALSMQGQNDTAGFVQAFTGSHRYVFDYLAEEILVRQPQYIQTFLLRTSILERLCGPLCDAVTEFTIDDLQFASVDLNSKTANSKSEIVNGQTILEYLEQANLFLIPLDGERRWYRYHHLFADFLRAHLRQSRSSAEVAALHLRAGQWHAANGLTAEAINHTLAAGNAEQAAQFIEQVILTLLANGEAATVIGWLESLPESLIRTRPRLSLGQAWAMTITTQWDKVEPLVQEAERILAANPATNQSSDDPVVRGFWGEIAALRSMLMANLGQAAQVIELSQQALERLPGNNLIVRSIILRNLGVAYEMSGELALASRTLNEARELALASDNLMIVLVTTTSLAQIEEDQGHLHQAAELYREQLRLIEQKSRTPGKPSHLAQWVYLHLAELLREQHDLEAAKGYLTFAQELEDQANRDSDPMAISEIILARILQAEGDPVGARQAIQQASQRISPLSALFPWVGAVQAWLWLAQGNLAQAVQWAENCGLPLDESFKYDSYPGEYGVLVRVWLAQGRHVEALALLGRMQAAAEAVGRTGRLVEILILQALALGAQQKIEPAVTTLSRALALAEAGGYIRLFADEGPPLAELLARISGPAAGVSPAYLDKLRNTLPGFKLPILDFGLNATERPEIQNLKYPKGTMSKIANLVEPLSERELEILALVAAGLSNQEIGERLVIAEGTVKKHLHNIFGKLDVRSRTQALLRAAELKLL